ncbi:MAG: ABC transporter permease, partial [Muribaculaceae bacterium]|nr:ABC transporter permease [Muribaculaceae bacterium]
MNISNLLKIALKALNNNKLRCFLTMLGVIIGVGAVIAMLAIGQGSKNSIKAQISEMGSNMIMIFPGTEQRGGVRQSSSDMQTLKPSDYEAIASQAETIADITPTVSSSGQWVYGNNNYPSQAQGVNSQYLAIRQRSVAEGEMFTEHEIKSAAKVCVLGRTLVENLFPDGSDPIG